jgi:hypothetical protein
MVEMKGAMIINKIELEWRNTADASGFSATYKIWNKNVALVEVDMTRKHRRIEAINE